MADVLLTIGLDSSAYSEFKKGIDDIIKKINSDPPKIKVQFENKELDKMRKQIEALTKAQREMAAANKQSKNIEVGSTQQYNALRQVNTALTQVILNTQRWTAAQRGQTSGSYSDYSQQATALQTLVDELEQGSITAEEFSNRFAQIRATMAQTSGEIKVAGEATGAMSVSLNQAASNIVKFIGVYRLISNGIRLFKEMASVSIEIESAMAQIQVVTGATGAELQGFFNTSTSLAKELGQSITDVAKSIETFSRLGFRLEDASSLAEYATILSNVADTDINAATTGMTSIIKGYDMDVKNAEHVADVLTKVGQAYAISAEELMTAFERGGASMYAEGTSFEKSAALFAATNASLQNAQKTGTIWNTVAARITASISDLEAMGEETEGLADGFSKYREELLALTGVDVQKSTGEYRDLYDIFVDLANVWDSLRSDQARSRVGEILGGTRNRAGIMSTITNIKDAINAYEDAMNSSGIAMQANDIIMATTEKHIEQLKVSFQELSANLISSESIKGIVDLGNGFLQLLNNIQKLSSGLGGLPAIIGAVTVAISALRAGSVLGGIGSIFQTAISGITGLGAAGATLTGTLGAVAPAVLAVVGAISALVGIFNIAKQSQADHLRELEKADEVYTTNTGDIETYKDRILELRTSLAEGTLSEADAYEAKKELLDIQNQLFDSYGKQVEGIDLVNGKLDEQIGKINELTKAEADKYLNEVKRTYGSIENIQEKLYGTFGGEAKGIFDAGTVVSAQIDNAATEEIDAIKQIVDEYDNLVLDELAGGQQFRIRYIGSVVDAHDELQGALTRTREVIDGFGDSPFTNTINGFFNDLSDVYDNAESVYNDYYELYQNILNAQHITELMNDETLYTRGDASDTAAGWLAGYSKRVDEYNKAMVFGDEEQIKTAKMKFETWTKIMDDLISGSGFSAYAEDVYKIRDGLIDSAKAVQDYDNAVEKSPSFRDAREKVSGMTALQVKDSYYFGEEGEATTQAAKDLVASLIEINKLESGFDESSLDSVLTWLTDCGVLLSEVAEEGENAESPVKSLLDTLTDSDGDFKKTVKEHTDAIDDLFTAYTKLKDGNLSDKEKQSLLWQFPELSNYADFEKGLETLINTKVSGEGGLIEYINQMIRDISYKEEGGLAARSWLIDIRDGFRELYNTSPQVEEYKGTVEDFYDIFTDKDFNDGLDTITDKIDKVHDALGKAQKGELTESEFVELAQSLGRPDLIAGIDDMAGALENLQNEMISGEGENNLFGYFETSIKSLRDAGSEEAAVALEHLRDIMMGTWDVVEEAKPAFDSAKESVESYSSALKTIQDTLSDQTTGRSIGLDTFAAENMRDYSSALEYHNGVLQYNAEKVKEIAQAKAEEEKATIAANKAQEQSTYLSNARKMAQLRIDLAHATDEEASSIQSQIDALAGENSTIADTCRQYDLMTASINEANNAYQNWINSQNASESGDMLDSATSAYNRINEILNDSESEDYGRVGRKDYKAALEFIVPDTIDREDEEAVNGYLQSISHLLTTDDKGQVNGVDIGTFLNEAVEKGLMNQDGDNYQVAGETTMQDFADGMGLGLPLVQSIFGELEEYDFSFDWADEADQTLGDMAVRAADAATSLSSIEGFESLPIDIDISQISDVDQAASQLQSTIDSLETFTASPDVSTEQVEQANTVIAFCKEQLDAISGDNPEVKLSVDDSEVNSWQAPDKEGVVTYSPQFLAAEAPILQGIVNYKATGAASTISVNGTAHASGTARAKGDWGTAPGGRTLVGELGQELVVNPMTGRWYTVGDRGAEFTNIPKGAIVFNHKQTAELLRDGYAIGRASALASGTAMVTGGGTWPFGSGNGNNATSQPSNNSGGRTPSSPSTPSSSSSSSSSDTKKETKEVFDWIEVRIARIERKIKNLDITANSTFQKLKTRLGASDKEIAKITKEINIQNKGYKRYMKEANKVGLSKSWRKKVQQGKIDIDTIKDEKLAEKIKDYQKWYEKALDCKDAVKELKEQLGELYEEQFNTIATDYENKLAQIEHKTNTYNNAIDNLEAHGYLRTTKYYEQLRSAEQENLSKLKQERDALNAALNKAVASGYIKKYSESWYGMVNEINGVNEAIQESETSIVEFGNSIREVEWEHFDYLQEVISNITKEADFLITLMSKSDLFQDNGQLTNEGMATMGLHAQNYNVYMAQASKYASELKNIEADIAKDKDNTNLLKRREELLELQRDSILAAEDEKYAIRDMVEEGINTELDALQKLIDKYNDALDSAKDLNDYQKKVRNQAGEVAKLQKQLSAYSGDNSEENRARLQKLRNDLTSAQETLQETEQEHYISEQKKLFSNLYDEYETTLNKRLDNVDQLITDMMAKVDDNGKSISKTLAEQAQSVGYTITQNQNSIWSSTGSGFSLLSNVNTTIGTISANVAAMVTKSNGIAAGTSVPTAGTNASTQQATNAANKETQIARQVVDSIKSGKKRSKTLTSAEKKSHHALWEYIVKKYGYAPTNAIYRNIASALGITVSNKPTSAQKNKILSAMKAKGLASGAKSILSDDMFWTNENGAETLVRKSDHAILTRIGKGDRMYNAMASENLWNAANNPANFIIESLSKVSKLPSGLGGMGIGSINYEVNIPIDHVGDYNDFMNQLKNDGRFEKFIQSMTVDRLVGRSKLAKNKYQW